jgi:hypothetical protein
MWVTLLKIEEAEQAPRCASAERGGLVIGYELLEKPARCGRGSEEFFTRQGSRSLPKAAMLNLVRTNVQLAKKINPRSEKKLLLIALLLGEGSRRKADELSSPESSSQIDYCCCS